MDLVIFHQENIHIESTQFITVDQVFMCLLGLLFKRSDLLFKL